jgi:FtsZ-binding cell division protein ZapB
MQTMLEQWQLHKNQITELTEKYDVIRTENDELRRHNEAIMAQNDALKKDNDMMQIQLDGWCVWRSDLMTLVLVMVMKRLPVEQLAQTYSRTQPVIVKVM